MKVILGVDLQDAYIPALQLLRKLEFANAELVLVQTAPPIEATLPPFPVDGAVIDLVQSTFREAAEKALAAAAEQARAAGLNARALFCLGPSGEMINEVATSEHADLVAVRSTHRGAWQSEFMGSVTRVVVLGGSSSVLIAKREPELTQGVDIVFGADGSEFNERCVRRFLALNPRGIGKVHVVSAWGCSSQLEHVLRHTLHHAEAIEAQLEARAQSSVERVCQQLTGAGFNARGTVVRGTPEQVLAKQMEATKSELLVIGAHGKGFIERLLIGSTSLHEVVNEPYSVLVLRP